MTLYIFIFLLSRFVFLSEGQPVTRNRFAVKTAADIAMALIAFEIEPLLWFLIVGTVIINLGLLLNESLDDEAKPSGRVISLLLGLALIIIFAAYTSPNLAPRIFLDLNHTLYAIGCGILLCLKESNFAIRAFVKKHQLVEKLQDPPKTENGRIIGNLERLLLFLFLWQGAALAATFIVAVKGLARFKKMEDDTPFAEYVIIGTFLSVLLAITAYFVSRLLAGLPLSISTNL
ncbi:hypothetical protein ACWPKO_03340 [Coraliomargarita sp. W4R53]